MIRTNTNTKNITAELPPVTFSHSSRAKYHRITVRPDKTVTVTIPRNSNQRQAEEFLKSKIDWIKKHLRQLEQQQQALQSQPDIPPIDLDKAQGELFRRLEHFSDKYNLPYNRAAFRCQRTKWGSCSSHDNISLNINIAFLPVHLQDYILLHELCHTRHMNHSKSFWAELDKYVSGKAKELQKELRGHKMRVRE